MINSYPDTFAVVEYHVGDSYAFPWGESRGNFYNIWSDGIPWFAYDGLWDAWPISTYQSKFLTRRNVSTPVTMSVGAELVSGTTYEITMRVCLELEESAPVNLRLYAVGVEDGWPSNPTYSRNTFRVAANTIDITVQPGDCVVVTRTISLSGFSNLSRSRIIAWAQEPLPGIPAEVYQAAKDFYPYRLLPETGDYDNDGDVDLDDMAAFDACMSGPDPDTAPSGPCLGAFDQDDDQDVDLEDFLPFQAQFGSVN